MANGGKITYDIGFNVDKTGLADLQKQLKTIQTMSETAVQKESPFKFSTNEARKALKQAQVAAREVQRAMNGAFDSKTGILNLQQFNQNLQRLDLDTIRQRFNAIGETGTRAFANIAKASLTTTVKLKETSSILDKMGTTLINTLKWTLSSGLINRVTGALSQAVGYVEHLDSSLNDIRIVTKKSADEMNSFAISANKAAQALGKSTTDYTEASLIYYQQGLQDEENKARTETTLKVANVTGQSTQAVSEELTAVWNGYKVSAEEAELYVDKIAAVAATTASNLEELSTGMSKVASAAANMGVDIDQLNAMLSTIISVTRQAPETAGTALKTIYARMTDLKLGESDEDGLKLGDVSGGLEKLGINILDTEGELKNLGGVIEEIGTKWDTWTNAQQAAIAQLLAGKRQYNNLVALFSNWDMYEKSINTSKNATGELQKQQDIYMESTEAHLQQLKAQWEDLYDSILDSKSINTITDTINIVLKGITNIIDGIGGGKTALLGVISMITTVFAPQIGKAFSGISSRLKDLQYNALVLEKVKTNLNYQAQTGAITGNAAEKTLQYQQSMSKYWHLMSAAQIEESNNTAREIADWQTKIDLINEAKKGVQSYYEARGNQTLLNHLNDKEALTPGSGANNAIVKDLEKQYVKLQETHKVYGDIRKTASDLRVNQDDNTKSVEKFEKQLKTLKQRFNELKTAKILDSEQLTMVEAKIKNLSSTLQQMKDNPNKILTAQDITDLEALGSIILKDQQQFEQFIEAIKKGGPEAAAAADQLSQALKESERYKSQYKAEQYSALVGGISGVVFSLQSLSNILDVINNKDLSFGKKLLQIMSNLLISVPMLLKGVRSVTSALANLGHTSKFATIEQRKLNIEQAKGSKNIWKQATAYLGLNQSMGATVRILGILAAALLAVGLALKVVSSYQKQAAENEAESAKIFADQAKEKAEAAKEEKESIDEVTSKYKELNEQYQKTGDISTLRNGIYELVEAHKLDIDTVTLLTGSYEDLTKALSDYRNKVNQGKVDADKASIQAAKNNMLAQSYNKVTQSNGFNFLDIGSNTSMDADLQGIMTYDYGTMGYQFDWSAFYQLDEERQAYVKSILQYYAGWNSDAKAILEQINENAATVAEIKQAETELQKDTVDKFFTEIFNPDYGEEITDYTEYEAAKEQLAQSIANELEIGYEEALTLAQEKLKSTSMTYGNFEAGNILAKDLAKSFGKTEQELAKTFSELSSTQLQFIANNKDLARTYKSPEEFLSAFQQRIEILESKDHRINIGVAIENSDGKAFKEEDIEKMFSNKNFKIKVGVSKEEFSKEDYQKQLGQVLNYYYKASQLENDYNNQRKKAIAEEATARQQVLQNEKETLEQRGQEILQRYGLDGEKARDYFSEGFNNATLGKLNEFKEQLTGVDQSFYDAIDPVKAISQYISDMENSTSNISEENALYIMYLKEAKGYTDDDLKQMNNKLSAYQDMQDYLKEINKGGKDYNGALKQINAGLKRTNELTKDIDFADVDWNKLKEGVDILKNLNTASIDNLQGAYSSLTSVVESYNETQTLTMDNLQTLLNMDTAYLSALQIEDGQMSINEEKLKQIALAKLDEAEATAYLQAMDELKNHTTKEGIEASTQAATTLEQLGNGAEQAAIKARAGAADWKAYWDAALNREGVANDAHAQQVGEALRARLQMIGLEKEQILNGNFKMSMQGASKSSSSSKDKQAQTEKHLERQEDIYHEINQELSTMDSTLQRIQKVQEHSWGISYKKSLEQQNKLLDKQLDKLKQKQKMQENDLATRRKQLEDVGVVFSKDGSVMQNSEQILNNLYADYNRMVDYYNSLSADEQTTYKPQLETAKNRIDAIEKKIDEYESGFSELQSTLDSVQDKYYEKIEEQVKEFNYEIELHLELNDARKEWDKFWSEVVEDVEDNDFGGQIAASFKQLKTLIGLGGDVGQSSVSLLTQHLRETVDEVWTQIETKGKEGIFGADTAKSKEQLLDFMNKLMESTREAKENLDNIADTYLKELESAQELIDKQVEGYELIGKHLEHNLEMIKMIDGEKAYDAIGTQYQQMYNNNLNLVETQRQSKDYWADQIKRYERLVNSTEEGSKEWKTYSEALTTSTENYRKAVEDLDSSVENAMKTLQEWRQNQVDATFDTLDKELSGGIGLTALEDQWKLINDYSNQYYDNVERYLNLEDYTNQLNKAANAVGLSAENQQKLNEFRETELSLLNKKAKLTEYDIAESKARLEIMKAEMALEDARRNKSNMRLRRDSQGNYTYQYTSDESQVEDAEAGILSAKKEWYVLVKKQYQDASQYAIDRLRDIYDYSKKYNEAKSVGDTKAMEVYKDLMDKAIEQTNFAYSEMEKNKQDLFKGTADYFAEVENASILPQSQATIRTLEQQWVEGDDSFIGAARKAIDDLTLIQEQYEKKTGEILKKAGEDYAKYKTSGIDPTTESLSDLIDTNEELGEKLSDLNSDLSEHEQMLRNAEAAYNDLKEAAVDAIKDAQNALDTLAKTAIDAQTQIQAAVYAANNAPSISYNVGTQSNTGSSDSGTGSSGGGGSGVPEDDTYSIKGGVTEYKGGPLKYQKKADPYVVSIEGKPAYTTNNKKDAVKDLLQAFQNEHLNGFIMHGTRRFDAILSANPSPRELMETTAKIVNLLGDSSFDTGGYTGSWDGSNGKWAMLHQKELVLNKDDTKNMLQAVQILRSLPLEQMASSIISASTATIGMMNAVSSNVQSVSAGLVTNNNSSKNMTVNADFSGVQSADAIYQALLELENYGLQESYSVAPNVNSY